jgi:hypothetical protein
VRLAAIVFVGLWAGIIAALIGIVAHTGSLELENAKLRAVCGIGDER